LTGERARAVVDAIERELWTPMGLRSLAPGEPGYAGLYEGPPWQRDAAYHQGTVWPWLIGAFVDAWLAVRGRSAEAKAEADRRFVAPLREHLGATGLGHVSEIADGDAPFTPRGCPFQAWSLGELLRLEPMVAKGGPAADAIDFGPYEVLGMTSSVDSRRVAERIRRSAIRPDRSPP
jgi:glycogen debranching enzyme